MNVAVRISGEGYITYAYKADVEVHNSLMSVDQPRQLFYSNSPERLERYQVLFAGKLQADAPTRVLYHHQNAMGKSVHFVVDITNPTDSPATYRITSCAAGPMVDTVLVGYLATRDFLRDMQSNASVIERVPPKSRLVIVSDTLRHLETSSGVLQIRQTDGSESYVRVAALPPGLDKASVGAVTAVGVRGATTSAFGIDPDLGLAVDVTATGDTPRCLKMEVALGKGPAVKVKDAGMLADPRVVAWMIRSAAARFQFSTSSTTKT